MSHCSATNRSDVVHNMCKDLSTQWIYVRQCNGWPDAPLNMLCATMLKYASLKCKSVHLISDYFLKWPFSGHLVFSLLESPSLYHVLQQEQWNPEHYEEPKDNNSIKKIVLLVHTHYQQIKATNVTKQLCNLNCFNWE